MIEVLERGDVLFMVRPTVQAADAPVAVPGVQSFFLVMSPAGKRLHRRVRVGKKRMPPPRARFWARVERVGTLQQVLADQLEDERYRTRTRGERFQPGARLIAQGCYAIVRHGDHCHLAYRLERRGDDGLDGPLAGLRRPASATAAREIDRDDDGRDGGDGGDGSEDGDDPDDRGGDGDGEAAPLDGHVPDAGSPLLLFEGPGRGGATWTTGGRVTLLDREGFELVLVGGGDDPEGTLGVDLVPYPFAAGLRGP